MGYWLHTRLSHYSETFNQAIHTMSFVKRAIAKTSVGCIQGTSLCLRNCFLFFLQRTRPIHYCRSKTHVSGSFRLQNRLLFSSNDTSFRNGSGTSTKWPETRVLDVKYVVRNQVDVLEHRNGVKIPKIWVLDRKYWNGHVCYKKTRNSSRGINSCIKYTSKPVFAMYQVQLRNGLEPPKTWVLAIK